MLCCLQVKYAFLEPEKLTLKLQTVLLEYLQVQDKPVQDGWTDGWMLLEESQSQRTLNSQVLYVL